MIHLIGKYGLAIIALMATWGLCACATAPKATSSLANPDTGGRELQRGIYWYQQGCTPKALSHLQAAHEHFSLANQPAGVARSLTSLANLYRQAGNPENALLFYDAAISTARRCDDQAATAQALSNKAAMLIDAGDLSAAEALLDEAQLLARGTGPSAAMILNHRAVLAMKTLHYDEALALLEEAESSGVEKPSIVAATLRYTRAKVAQKTGDYERAMDLFRLALEQDRQMGFSRGMAGDLLAMAAIHQQMGRSEEALDCLEQSLKIHALLGNGNIVLENLERLESLAEQTGSDARVAVHFINQWLAGEAVDVVCR